MKKSCSVRPEVSQNQKIWPVNCIASCMVIKSNLKAFVLKLDGKVGFL